MDVNQSRKTVIVKYTPVFKANLKAYESGLYRVIANQGSSRSSKSYSIVQLLIKIALEKKLHISVVSPSLPHLKRGVRKDFIDILNIMGLYTDNDFNKTDNIYKFPSTGSIVEFFGGDEVGKLRGPGRDVLFINEANLISFEAFTQLSIRTRKTIFIDFNPADEHNWVYGVADKEGNKLIHSTYLNNKGNLTKETIEDIEGLKLADENLWRVFGLGLRGSSKETIYTHYRECDSFPVCNDVTYGLDFGYNHPAALVKVGWLDGAIYAEELLYEKGLTNNDLAYLIKTNVGLTRSSEVFCDTARPEAIAELIKYGVNAKPADKSVKDGILAVKSFPLFITKKSTNLLKEIRNYKWKVDKDGKALDEPVKVMDDLCDSLRYAVYSRISKVKKTYSDASY